MKKYVIKRLENFDFALKCLGKRRLHQDLALFNDLDGAPPTSLAIDAQLDRRKGAAPEDLLKIVFVVNAA